MSRSNLSCGARSLTLLSFPSPVRCLRSDSFFKMLCLATVSPCDDNAKKNIEQAEACSHVEVPPRSRAEKCNRAQDHKAHAFKGNDADGECASGDDARAVKQKPHAGTVSHHARSEEDVSQKSANQNRRRQSENKLSGRAR